MAIAVALGGLLDRLQAIRPWVLLTFVGAGLVIEVAALARTSSGAGDRLRAWMVANAGTASLLAGWAVVVLLLAVRYLGAVAGTSFNEHDDLQGYFVFPAKMLQTGSLGPDPFSDRRLVSSLGGQYFLQTLVLCLGDFDNLHLLDSGIAMLVMVGMLVGLAARFALGPGRTLLLLLVFLLAPLPRANITSLLTGAVLLLGLYRSLLDADRPTHRLAALGVMGGAIVALKSTLLVPAFLCLLLFFAIRAWCSTAPLRELVHALAAALLALAVLVPWMLSMHESSGTYLYPVLGKGFHVSSYAPAHAPYAGLTWRAVPRVLLITITGLPFLAFAALALLQAVAARARERPGPMAAIVGATASSTLLVALSVAGYDPERYTWPILVPALLLLAGSVTALPERERFAAWPVAHLGLAICALWIGFGWEGSRRMVRDDLRSIVRGLRGVSVVEADDRARARAVQDALPAGAGAVLTRVSKPFLFDFRRHRIYIADNPAGASPPPGMPSFEGEERLADYLLSRDITYVVYSHGDQAGFTMAEYGEWLEETQHPWVINESARTFDFQESLSRLGRSRRRLFDDGSIFVLDLGTRVASP
jgi:hypothetical protein